MFKYERQEKIHQQRSSVYISVILKEKVSATRDRQKKIRDQMRKIGFYISDFTSSLDGFGLKSFEKLISSGSIEISDKEYSNIPNQNNSKTNISASGKIKEAINGSKDEEYIIDLCDRILGEISLKQHRFDFLTGDPNERGYSAKLPVDAFYHSLKLVVEYREKQHTKSVKHFDKPDRITVSGVHRGEQRKIYDERRRDILPKHGINLVEISFTDFRHNSQKRIIRDTKTDTAILRMISGLWLPEERATCFAATMMQLKMQQ